MNANNDLDPLQHPEWLEEGEDGDVQAADHVHPVPHGELQHLWEEVAAPVPHEDYIARTLRAIITTWQYVRQQGLLLLPFLGPECRPVVTAPGFFELFLDEHYASSSEGYLSNSEASPSTTSGEEDIEIRHDTPSSSSSSSDDDNNEALDCTDAPVLPAPPEVAPSVPMSAFRVLARTTSEATREDASAAEHLVAIMESGHPTTSSTLSSTTP